MTDEILDSLYIVRAFDLIEPFAERLREADSRNDGDPVPNYQPLLDTLTTYSGRVEAISETYPSSPYRSELRDIADDLRRLSNQYPTREGIDDKVTAIAGQLEVLADDEDATTEAFEGVLDDFESLIVIIDTLHEGYSHLVAETELAFAND